MINRLSVQRLCEREGSEGIIIDDLDGAKKRNQLSFKPNRATLYIGIDELYQRYLSQDTGSYVTITNIPQISMT